MRVLSQSEIDAMLAQLLANPSILPDSGEKKEDKERPKEENK